MSSSVSISLMGPFALRIAGQRLPLRLAGNTKRIFMLLGANANRGLRRDRVIEEIFPERPNGKACAALNTGIWRIKSQINNHDGVEIESIDDVIRLDISEPAQLDTLQLEMALSDVKPKGPEDNRLCDCSRDRLLSLITSIRGEFLEGVSEHWVLPLRERYATMMIEALSLLMYDAAACGSYERALSFGRKILELDPFREGTQCEVMWLYMQNRQRVQAIRQYQKFEALLKDELGIEPMEETREVYESIRCTSAPNPSQFAVRPDFGLMHSVKA